MNVEFPIDRVLPELFKAFSTSRRCVLSAPPGAGKTTRVPIALLEAEWMTGSKLIMLEPRRLAARRAAEFMAGRIGQRVGETIGYRIRGDTRVSSATRIEVVTEGVLTRLLHSDPSLPGVALVVFDEFHERSIHADLGLALTLDVQDHLRDDIRLLVMSATLRSGDVAGLLGAAPIVEASGQLYPVETRYLASPADCPPEQSVCVAVRSALRESPGDILVFLPGQREIRRVARLLEEQDIQADVHMLFGEAGWEQQQAALAPAGPGARKVILSTSIAETSLTIEGVRAVVDAGLARRSQFDPRRGMSGLMTEPVSKAAADQRRGRAGRQGPGICYRLWTEKQHVELVEHPAPEIVSADLAQLELDLTRWGNPGGEGLRFLDPPPPAHVSRARSLLASLGALGPRGELTPHGRAIAEFPIHPRLAHMLVCSRSLGMGGLACEVAALLEERDPLQSKGLRDIDFALRWSALRSRADIEPGVRSRILAEAQRLRDLLGVHEAPADGKKLGMLLALAYPERIAQRRLEGKGRYQMSGGTGALVPEASILAREEFLAVADVDGSGTEVRVFLAAPLQRSEIEKLFADRFENSMEVFWDAGKEMVLGYRTVRLGALVMSRRAFNPSAGEVLHRMIEGIGQMGIGCLPWKTESENLRLRSEWLRLQGLVEGEWPDLSDEHLLGTLDLWLGPFLAGIRSRSQLHQLNMLAILKSMFSHTQMQQLDRLAPAALSVPTGSRIHLDYSSAPSPILPVRLQEMFGESESPKIAGGKVSVLIHLLSPAGRPLAVTQDLRSFWTNAYPEVRRQMRGRYPKHYWPEDPSTAPPTRRPKGAGHRR